MALIEINWQPEKRVLRQFALIWFPAFCALLGVIVWRKADAWTAACIIWGAGVAISIVGLLVLPFMRIVYCGLMCVTLPIGWVVSHVVLAVVYFLVFTLIGKIMLLLGKDPLHRKFDRSAKSYWVAHNPGGNTARYFRQS